MREYDELQAISGLPILLELSRSAYAMDDIVGRLSLIGIRKNGVYSPEIDKGRFAISMSTIEEVVQDATNELFVGDNNDREVIEIEEYEVVEDLIDGYDPQAYANHLNRALSEQVGLQLGYELPIDYDLTCKALDVSPRPIDYGFAYINDENGSKFIDLLRCRYKDGAIVKQYVEQEAIFSAMKGRSAEYKKAKAAVNQLNDRLRAMQGKSEFVHSIKEVKAELTTASYMVENIENGFLPTHVPDVFFDTNNFCFVVAEEYIDSAQSPENSDETDSTLTAAA